MHELLICSNKCCNRYKSGYAEAVEWMKTQPPFSALKTTASGNRMCNYCGIDNSWSDRACPGCGTRFGHSEPDDSDDDLPNIMPENLKNEVKSDSAFIAEMMKAALSQQNPSLPEVIANEPEDDQNDMPRCEVCEWYNPRGIMQCVRCTAFLPFVG